MFDRVLDAPLDIWLIPLNRQSHIKELTNHRVKKNLSLLLSTGHTLNVYKTFRRRPERLMYV